MRSPYDQLAADALGVSAQCLNAGVELKGQPVADIADDDMVAIPEFRIEFSAGPGSTPSYEEVHDSKPVYYAREWIQRHGLNIKYLRRFTVHGESMQPLLWEGDKILCDCTPYQQIKSGRIYCFSVFGEDRVKRLFRMLDGAVLIRSENPEFPEEKMSAADWEESAVLIGRVVDKSGAGGL